MNQPARHIELCLLSGDHAGMRTAALGANPLVALEVPRVLLTQFRQMEAAKQVALYFLFGPDVECEKTTVYIGESDGIGTLLAQHHSGPKKMSFWTRAIVVVSKLNDLTKTHGKYLEAAAIKEANAAKRYVVHNGNEGSKPHTPASVKSTCDLYFPDIRLLLGALGKPVMEPWGEPKTTPPESGLLFHCKSAAYDATAVFSGGSLLVRKGSRARKVMAKSLSTMGPGKRRLALVQAGKLKPQGDYLVFQEDVLFESPSSAAGVITGNSSDGWLTWRTTDGKRLSEFKPQAVAA